MDASTTISYNNQQRYLIIGKNIFDNNNTDGKMAGQLFKKVRNRCASSSMPNMQIFSSYNSCHGYGKISLIPQMETTDHTPPLLSKKSSPASAYNFSCVSLVDDEEMPDHFDNDEAFMCRHNNEGFRHCCHGNNEGKEGSVVAMATEKFPNIGGWVSASDQERLGDGGQRQRKSSTTSDQWSLDDSDSDFEDDPDVSLTSGQRQQEKNLHNQSSLSRQQQFYATHGCRLVDPVAWTLNCRVFAPIVS